MFSTAILMFTDQCSIGKTNINWMNNVYFCSSSKHQNHWFASYVNPVFFIRYFKICPVIWRYVDGFKLWRKSSFGPPPVTQILMDNGYGMTLTCIIVQLKGTPYWLSVWYIMIQQKQSLTKSNDVIIERSFI